MGRLAQKFPRFPHRCVIYTMQEPTGFETEQEIDALKKVVWEGRCRKESNTSIRTFKGTENVIKGDYRVQLGALVGGSLQGDADAAPDGRRDEECGAVVCGLKAGLLVDVYDRDSNHFSDSPISPSCCSCCTSPASSTASSSSSDEEEDAPMCTLNLNDAYVGNLGTTLYCDEYKT